MNCREAGPERKPRVTAPSQRSCSALLKCRCRAEGTQRAGRQAGWGGRSGQTGEDTFLVERAGLGAGIPDPFSPVGRPVCLPVVPAAPTSSGWPSGKTLATWELQEVDIEQKRH